MNKFLEAHNLPRRLNHKVTEKLNKPTTRGLINNQKPPYIENPETYELTGKLHQTFKEQVIPTSQKSSQKLRGREYFQSHSTRPDYLIHHSHLGFIHEMQGGSTYVNQ